MTTFEGYWQLDATASSVWAGELGRYVPDEVGEEYISITEADGVQDYEVVYGDAPRIRMGYACAFDRPEWVGYLTRQIGASPEGHSQEEAVQAFKQRIRAADGENSREFVVGKPYGLVRLVSGDERTHYRIGARADTGALLYSMMRRLDEDGAAYTAHVFDVHGVVNRIRRFVRSDESAYRNAMS